MSPSIEYYVLPSPDAVGAFAEFFARHGGIELKLQPRVLPDPHGERQVYILGDELMKQVESSLGLRGKYVAFYWCEGGTRIYRHRSPGQIARSRERRKRKLLKRAARKEARAS